MSSSNRLRLRSWSDRLHSLRFLVLAAPLTLVGCFQPLYGTLGPGGLESELQAIKVDPIPNRIGHYLENELCSVSTARARKCRRNTGWS